MLFLRKGLVILFLLVGVFTSTFVFAANYESIEVIDLARMLSPSMVALGNKTAFVTIEGGNIKIRKDGQALATATGGHLAGEGDTIQLKTRKDIVHLSFIRASGNTSTTTIYITYED